MGYLLDVHEKLDARLKKLGKKNRKLTGIIDKKVKQILANPHHFKPLRGNMQTG